MNTKKGFKNFDDAFIKENVTEWELSKILRDKDLFDNTIFHVGGKEKKAADLGLELITEQQMIEFESVKGFFCRKNIYWDGNYTALLSIDEKGEFEKSINLVDCISFMDNGMCNSVINGLEVVHLDMGNRFLLQKLRLNVKDYKQVRIEIKNGDKLTYFNSVCRKIVISDNIHLFNPVSEDKYTT